MSYTVICAGPGPHDTPKGLPKGFIEKGEGDAPPWKKFCTAAPCQKAAKGYTYP